MGESINNVVQVIRTVHTAEQLRQVKGDFSLRGRQFITKHPDYIYEISIDKEEAYFVITFILRPKTSQELEEAYDDY